MDIKTPKALSKGDTITMVAPSFGIASEPYITRYAKAIKNLKKLGYKIEEGKNVYLNEGVVASASPEARGEEFMKAYESDSSAIFSVGGGELMIEMLPYVDFEKIKKLPPKWFMGFSDNTNLTYTLTTLCGVKSIYGPCAPSFYEWPLRLNQLDAMEILEGKRELSGYQKWRKPSKKVDPEKPINPLARTRYMSPKVITPYRYKGEFSGIMLGGCLDILLCLVGTKYDKTKEFISSHPEGIIWYLEACDLTPLSVRRGLFTLKEAGWFKNAKGFIIGRPLSYDFAPLGLDRFEAVKGILGDMDLPILMDADLGHLPPAMPFINGSLAKVSLANDNIHIKYLD